MKLFLCAKIQYILHLVEYLALFSCHRFPSDKEMKMILYFLLRSVCIIFAYINQMKPENNMENFQ